MLNILLKIMSVTAKKIENNKFIKLFKISSYEYNSIEGYLFENINNNVNIYRLIDYLKNNLPTDNYDVKFNFNKIKYTIFDKKNNVSFILYFNANKTKVHIKKIHNEPNIY